MNGDASERRRSLKTGKADWTGKSRHVILFKAGDPHSTFREFVYVFTVLYIFLPVFIPHITDQMITKKKKSGCSSPPQPGLVTICRIRLPWSTTPKWLDYPTQELGDNMEASFQVETRGSRVSPERLATNLFLIFITMGSQLLSDSDTLLLHLLQGKRVMCADFLPDLCTCSAWGNRSRFLSL